MNRGFTLIEVLMYLALMSLLMLGCHAGMLLVMHASARTTSSITLLREGILVMERIRYLTEESEDVLEARENRLVLRKDGGLFVFEHVDGILTYTAEGFSAPLLPPPVRASSFSATLTYPEDDPRALRIELELTDPSSVQSRTFSAVFYP